MHANDNTDRIASLSVTCPHCSSVNEVTAESLPDGFVVCCSQCHEPIGAWRDLARPGDNPGAGSPRHF